MGRRFVALSLLGLAFLAAPGDALVDLTCPTGIRPGTRTNGLCTLNFVVTDGTDLYIGAAGHCATVGERLRIPGIPGELGTVVMRRFDTHDYAFVRIDPEDRAKVDPTMCRFGGPHAGPTGATVRAPLPGEAVLHYGWGNAAGTMEESRGRAGVALADAPKWPAFIFAGSISSGDSGSPVRLATGEAAGIAVAVYVPPGWHPNAVLASKFDVAMDALAASIGKPVTLVTGAPPTG